MLNLTESQLDYIEKKYLTMNDSNIANELGIKENEVKSIRYKYDFIKQRQTINSNTNDGEKWCWHCSEFHSHDMFNKNRSKPDGLQDECRIANKKIVIDRKNRKKQKDLITEKLCECCNIKQDIKMFIKNVSTNDGYSNKCKVCINETNKTNKYNVEVK